MIWGIVFVVIVGIVVYNLPYFQELRFYNRVMDERSLLLCQNYYDQYPEGRHYEDVMYLETELSFHPIRVITTYLHKFPEGKYAAELNATCDSLWDEEIAKYDNRDKTYENKEAVAFMSAMLQHMKRERVCTVLMDIQPHVSLKDYDEYDAGIRKYLEIIMSDAKLPLRENIVSLKENFTQEDRYTLMQILSKGLKESFDRMFSSDFVSIVTDASEAGEESPKLTFEYVIKNNTEDEEGKIPSIWTYSSNNEPKAYILAIDVKFQVHYSIPGSDVAYTYSEVGAPAEDISGIDGISDGYRRMTSVCFAKFSNKMSARLGLEQTY